jgi:hypothetical protein
VRLSRQPGTIAGDVPEWTANEVLGRRVRARAVDSATTSARSTSANSGTAWASPRASAWSPSRSATIRACSAVQIATALDAEVTGVCGTSNVELVRSLGAHHVIDYTAEDFTRSQQRFDVILDNVLNHPPPATARVLAPKGVLIPNSIGYTGGLLAGLPRIARAVLLGIGSTTVKLVPPAINRENLGALLELLESGQVRVVIDRTYPLDQAASAVTHMLEHHAQRQDRPARTRSRRRQRGPAPHPLLAACRGRPTPRGLLATTAGF